MKKRREQSVDGRLDYAASQIAVALRNTLRKYGSFVDELIKIQRVVEDARSIHQSLYHAIDGKVCDMLTYYNARVTPPNSFVGQLYSAITGGEGRYQQRSAMYGGNPSMQMPNYCAKTAAMMFLMSMCCGGGYGLPLICCI